MEYRHEWKHVISYSDLLSLRQRLRVLLLPDSHAGPNRSLSSEKFVF